MFGMPDLGSWTRGNGLAHPGGPSEPCSRRRLAMTTFDFAPLFRTAIAFERRFVLADHIVVEGADLQNGLLHVGLKRVVPESLKPRRIAISTGAPAAAGPAAVANDPEKAAEAA